MFVELHMLQNFAPSNLNRDDTGAPKSCEFGGYRRARISSQCLKRSIRTAFKQGKLLVGGGLPSDRLAVRTKRLIDALASRIKQPGVQESEIREVIEVALQGMGFGLVTPAGRPDERLTEYLVFLGENEIAGLAEKCVKHWDALHTVAAAARTAAAAAAAKTPGTTRAAKKVAKKTAKASVPDSIANDFKKVLDGRRAADLALFGRMLADLPDKNTDAACQVAHAISTNTVKAAEFDFYTAVDDRKPDDTAGADMLGVIEFNSACYYRYANVDLGQLRVSSGDTELARSTLKAFLHASVEAIPTGKQNSMAAQSFPSLVFAVARESGLWSLANAFVQPVKPDGRGDLMENSVSNLDAYWGRLTKMYGSKSIVGGWVATMHEDRLDHLTKEPDMRVNNIDALVEGVMKEAKFDPTRRNAAA